MTDGSLSPQQCDQLFDTVNNDGVICYPTEAVWGLGCHPCSQLGFEKILSLKQRPIEKGVILIAATLEQITPYAKIPNELDELHADILSVWQGFTTCILPKTEHCPDYLCGQYGTIAVRLTNYPLLKNICLASNTALVSTSANISQASVVSNLSEAKQLFGGGVDYYLDAALGGEKKPSRIIDFTKHPAVVVRE